MTRPENRIGSIFLLVTTFTYLLQLQSAAAQTTRPDQPTTQYTTFSPSIAVIIIVLITALFFLGFFSIYIRHCSDNSAATRGGTVRPIGRSRRNAAARGLDAALIETLPTFAYSEVKHLKIGKGALECAVCLNEFEDDETLRLLPKCDHVFHPECIDAWLSSHTTCPVCRANLAEIDTVEDAPVPEDSTVEPEAVNDRESVAIEVAEEADAAADDGGSVNRSRPMRSRSIKSMIWSKFPRSHSTGHSLIQPGENVDRFTLKLPDQIRQEIMTRALNRTTSLVVLPRETSSRRGYRTTAVNGGGEGSSRGKSYRRLGSLDRPDRWMFSMAPPFLTRESSMKKSNRSTNGSEGTSGTSKRFNLIGRLSFNRFGGSKRNEAELMAKGNNNNNESSLPV